MKYLIVILEFPFHPKTKKTVYPLPEEIQIEKVCENRTLGTILMYVSSMPWSGDSGEIIANLLLHHNIEHTEMINWESISKKQKEIKADTVIVVTHPDEAIEITKQVRKEYKQFQSFKIPQLSTGDILVYEIEKPKIIPYFNEA